MKKKQEETQPIVIDKTVHHDHTWVGIWCTALVSAVVSMAGCAGHNYAYKSCDECGVKVSRGKVAQIPERSSSFPYKQYGTKYFCYAHTPKCDFMSGGIFFKAPQFRDICVNRDGSLAFPGETNCPEKIVWGWKNVPPSKEWIPVPRTNHEVYLKWASQSETNQ